MTPHKTQGTPVTPDTSAPYIHSVEPNDERAETPPNPKTSGAPKPAPDTSKSPLANRDIEGPRKASTTPRPTDKPVSE